MKKDKDANALVYAKVKEIEQELKRLHRWDAEPLSEEKFNDMGAFGSNTMSFEQWLQFVLIPRVNEIITKNEELPSGSMLAPYAIRVFDGDSETTNLHDLLYQLDGLVNGEDEETDSEEMPLPQSSETVSLGDTTIPAVLFTLADLLPQFQDDDLENQLQTFDTFLTLLSPLTHNTICELLLKASRQTPNEVSKRRLEDAVQSIRQGKFIAKPYNHEDAMSKYREEHKKSFPS